MLTKTNTIFIAITLLILLSGLLTTPPKQQDIQLDNIECSNSHMWLKEYTTPYDPSSQASALSTSPGFLSYYDGELAVKSTGTATLSSLNTTGKLTEMCKLQNKYPLYYDGTTAYLNAGPTGTQMKYVKYERTGTTPDNVCDTLNKATTTFECAAVCSAKPTWQTGTIKYGKLNFAYPSINTTKTISLCATLIGTITSMNTETLKDDANTIPYNVTSLQQDGTAYCFELTTDAKKALRDNPSVNFTWDNTVNNQWQGQDTEVTTEPAPYLKVC